MIYIKLHISKNTSGVHYMAHFKDIVPAIPLSNSVTSIQNGLSEILYLKHRARARN